MSFINWNVIEQERFFARKMAGNAVEVISTAENAARIANALQDGKKVLVRSPRRCGKSTLIKMVCGLKNVDAIYVSHAHCVDFHGAKASLYTDPTDPDASPIESANKCLIFDEPWLMDRAWVHLLTDGPRLFIGTPDQEQDAGVLEHGEKLCDVVERLGFKE